MMSRHARAAALFVTLALVLQGCSTTPPKPATPAAPKTAAAPEVPPQPPAAPVTPPAPVPAPPETPAPIQAPKPEPAAPVACKPPAPAPAPARPAPPQTTLAVLGEVEYLTIDPPGLQLKARLDTGAAGSTLHALDVREFERDGKAWVKFQLVDASTGKSVEVSRPVIRTQASKDATATKHYVVSLKATIAGIAQFTEFTLADRSSSKYPALIGRNFLRDQAVVDVGHRFTKPASRP
jgi:hypothetical protein